MAEYANAANTTLNPTIEKFYTEDNIADVGELIEFTWEISDYSDSLSIRILFGDGNYTLLTAPGWSSSYSYRYSTEGRYNATMIIMAPDLYIWKSVTDPNGNDLLIEIINVAPEFESNDISFSWESENGPYEDEEIQVSVDLSDSIVDLEEGKITYIYDFGDGEQIISNQSSTLHIWNTTGNYPISITAKDDQGALTQRTRFLKIKNKDPEPKFTLGAGIPATYSFTEDIIGDIPFGWNLSDTEYSKYAFEIIEEKNSHGKVLSVMSNETISTSKNYIYNDIGFQNYGTVEFQFIIENSQSIVSSYFGFSNDDKEIFAIFVENGNWRYCTDGNRDNTALLGTLPAPKDNIWYHVRVDFHIISSQIPSDSSCYGLAVNEFRVSIDGSIFAKKRFDPVDNPLSSVRIGTFEGLSKKTYIDSIGYSWDKNYNIGDNFNVYTPEYYGTYDWREGSIGSSPNGWEVYNDDIPSKFENNPFYTENFIDENDRWRLTGIEETSMHIRTSVSDDAYVNNLAKNTNYGTQATLNLDTKTSTHTMTVCYRYISNADHPAILDIEIPNLPIISATMDLRAYCDAQDQSGVTIRAIYFDIDGRGAGAIGCWTREAGQVRGDGVIGVGAEKSWTYDMTHCRFPVAVSELPSIPNTDPETGSRYVNFIPQSSSDTSGFFSPGAHTIKAFVTSRDQYAGSSQDSWVSITLNLVYNDENTQVYIKNNIPYLSSNITDNSKLDIYVSQGTSNSKVKLYSTSDFSENTITWNNRPSRSYISTYTISGTGWHTFNLGKSQNNFYYSLSQEINKGSSNIRFYSSEYSDSSKRPVVHHYLSKYYQGDGTLYCQTDQSEILTLTSPNNLNRFLRKGDKIEISFKTTSAKAIQFNLIDTVGLENSFEISSEGNSNFNIRTISLVVQDNIYIDYMEFAGLFNSETYLLINSIKFFEGIRSDISYIDIGNDFGKVIQLRDRSTQNQLRMDNIFNSQNEGTIEFWMHTNNILNEIWSISVYTGTTMIFKLSTKNNQWVYSSNGGEYIPISDFGIAEENQWYHLKIDFNNNTSQFNLTLDDIYMTSIEGIIFKEFNKIRFGTVQANEGTTYIDAIGYSWDDNYNIGDNNISLVLYPEKTKIQFSAADSIDTISDYDTLKYYWDFGDGTSGYGKNVIHDYLTSGNYIITLVCKDDNGATSSFSQIIKVYNTYPEISFVDNLETIAINEGDTVFFNAESWDEITDYASLNYYWAFESINNNIFDFEDSIEGGWRQSHMYQDDYYGDVGVLVEDTEGDYNYDFSRILVRNVDPLISIYDAIMIANISFEVVRSNPTIDANITFELLADSLFAFSKYLDFHGLDDLSVVSDKELAIMSLSKDWKVNVYSTEILPAYSWFRYNIYIEYLDGTNTTITSGKIYGNSNGEWSLNLNPYWVNSIDNTFSHPITFNAEIFDPSVDDIFVNIKYDVDMLVEISCSDNIPLDGTFIINQELGDVTYIIEVYQVDGGTYAKIHATQNIYEKSFYDNEFPTQLEFEFNIFPIINLEILLNEQLGLENLEILDFLNTLNTVTGNVVDDDGGSNNHIITFPSIFDFSNLSPSMDIAIPNNNTINEEVSFLVVIEDFNQIDSEINFDYQEVVEDDVPNVPNDFEIINGTISDSNGELEFNDDNYITIDSEFHIIENQVFYDDFNDTMRDLNWIDETNFDRIKEDDGVLKLKASSFSLWQNFSRWFLSWAPYSKISLSKFNTEWWEIQVDISKQCYSKIGNHHYGLMLFQDEENVWLFGATNDGKIKITKIIDREAIDVVNLQSNDTTLRISKVEGKYYFESSIDKENWNILFSINSLEINATDTGIFHRVTFPYDIDCCCYHHHYRNKWCDYKHCCKSWKNGNSKHYCKSWKAWDNKYCCKSWKSWNYKHYCKSFKHYWHKNCHCCSYRDWVFFDNFSMIEKYSTDHLLNFTTTLDLDTIGNEQILEHLYLIADYKTTLNQLIDISIYNFQKNIWEIIDSSYINTDYHHLNYTIQSLGYLDLNNQIHVRFEARSSDNEFQLLLDKLQLEYSSSMISNYQSEQIPFIGVDVANIDDNDISIIANKGSLEHEGDLSLQDNNYATYSSSGDIANLAFITAFALDQAQIDDGFTSITLSYSFRTNIYQLVNVTVYNYTSQEWILINRLNQNEFNELIFEFDTSQTEFFNLNEIYVKFEAINNTNSFTFDLDLLRIDYSYFPHHLISDNIRNSEFNLPKENRDYAVYNSQDNDLEFNILMSDMNSLRKFNLGVLYYSIQSSISQEMNLYLYNFSGKTWNMVDTFIAYNSNFISNEYLINTSDYLSPNNYIRVKFEGTIQNEYNLFIEELGIIYKWSDVWGQYGSKSNRDDFNSLGYISNEYSFIYWGNTNFYMNGEYLIIITADDGYNIIRKGGVINIINMPPYAEIGPIETGIKENEEIQLTSELFFYGKYAEETRFEWSFGDGLYAYEQNPTHYWSTAGTYTIQLTIKDCFGNIYTDNATITIEEHPPEILGPYTFYGKQGQAIVLDVEIYDSFYDEMNLQYEWYSVPSNEINIGTLFSTDKKPVVFLDWGNYTYSLKVIDQSGYYAITNITIEVDDIPPVVSIGSYMYHGGKGNSISIKAYVYDSYLENEFKFTWTIQNDLEQLNQSNIIFYDKIGQIAFTCKDTIVYDGEIKITDSFGLFMIQDFYINSFIDTNGNGFSDEIEEQLAETGHTIWDAEDTDNDGYSDIIEEYITFTLPNNPDCDGDGLSDGTNSTTGFGELTFGTDPWNPDSDGDLLEDGFEVFGWNITVNSLDVFVSSNPVLKDTDNDGIGDYDEYIMKLDPRSSDTDGDGIDDLADPYPITYDYDEDGLSDYEELQIGTQLNNTDTDGDTLTDGEEVLGWYFKTNPLSQDSDHDFLSDNNEINCYTTNSKYYRNQTYIGSERVKLEQSIYLPFKEKIEKALYAKISFTIAFGEYGNSGNLEYGTENIPNIRIQITKNNIILYDRYSNNSRYVSDTIDIKDHIENSINTEYYGNYIISVDKTDSNCMLENFQFDIARYLDPNNDDFDNDGILDGVETSLIVKGEKVLDFKNSYPDELIITNSTEDNYYNEISLEIPSIGRVNDAELYFKINSKNILYDQGSISVELIKEELNNLIEDPVLISYSEELPYQSIFQYMMTFDLGDLLNSGVISEYYGKYNLRVLIESDTEIDEFIISDFYIITNSWIQAGLNDWSAWITDPAKWSTDKDSLSDKYEIDMGYNPQSEDTDGDGIWDHKDVDPLHNLIVEVDFINAEGGSHLEAGVKMRNQGKDLTIWTPYTIYSTTLDRQYYIDIDDSRSSIDLSFYLYNMHHIDIREEVRHREEKAKNPLAKLFWWVVKWIVKIISYVVPVRYEMPDTKLGQWSKNYNLGDTNTYNLKNGDKKLNVKVSTIALSRTNTIAVYDKNSSFNGHYKNQEKMNVFHLHVDDDTISSKSPFVNGINTVIIPTRIFSETKLNALIQNEKLEGTPLEGCEFSSVERDDSGESKMASENIDFVIIQKNLSAEDAEMILNWLLEVLINETTDETAFLNSFISTKLNNIEIEQMNVNIDILKITPSLGTFENSPEGEKPIGDWGTAILKTLQNYISMIISLAQSIIELIEFIVDAIVNSILMAVLSFLGDLIWLLIRAAILILVWILFVFTLIGFGITFLAMIPFMLIISGIIGAELIIKANSLKLIKEDTNIELSYNIIFDYIDFFDIYIPTLKISVTFNDLIYEAKINFFSTFNPKMPMEFIPDDYNKPDSANTLNTLIVQNNLENTEKIKTSSDSLNLFSALAYTGFFAAMSMIGAVMSIHAAITNGLSKTKHWELLAFGITITAFVTSIGLLICTLMATTDRFSSFVWGLAWGFLLSFFEIVFIFGLGGAANIPKAVGIFGTVVAAINIIANISLFLGFDIMAIPATIIDIMAVALGCFSILAVNDKEAKDRLQLTYISLSLCLHLLLFLAFAFILVVEESQE
ncbi:MAG: PKD domain-containing protein [Candidatus Lokiarchaeota archaeon]|nr:PKD domain-containing protein [Candidatus Lokiarchaeota archaeon]